MSDDEADPELLALLRESLGLNGTTSSRPLETRVLEGAEYVYDNSVDVALDMHSTKAAASAIWNMMQEKDYSCKTWSEHELHPQAKDESTVNFIFIMDLLNFCFWSDTEDPGSEFFVDFRQKRWTGYWSLVASLQRALDEGIPITSPVYWLDESSTDDELRHVFRSASLEPMPMLEERISCIREAGRILNKEFRSSFLTCIEEANGSAAALVNLLVDNFPCFKDTTRFEGKTIRFYKRAQILVADLWACFEGTSYGRFDDIDTITMFAVQPAAGEPHPTAETDRERARLGNTVARLQHLGRGAAPARDPPAAAGAAAPKRKSARRRQCHLDRFLPVRHDQRPRGQGR